MPSLLARGAAVVVLCVVSLYGCATAQGSQAAASSSNAATPAAIARARTDSARRPYTSADIHFMSGMIGHHAQALAMSAMAATHDAGPAVRTLADRIINGQRDEIVTMQTWLRDRQLPVPMPDPRGGPMKMSMHGMEHEMLMPGMLSAEQMRQLDAARGAEFDRLFLVFMIQHHRGAVSMVKELFDSYGAAQDDTVFKVASDANVDQTTEIARMERMLAALTLEGRR